jgi:hypothetical protein
LKAGYQIASHRNLNFSFLNFQVAIDAASIPKDAKIAVLEKSSTESEKKIAGKSLSTFMFMQIAYFKGPSGRIRMD